MPADITHLLAEVERIDATMTPGNASRTDAATVTDLRNALPALAAALREAEAVREAAVKMHDTVWIPRVTRAEIEAAARNLRATLEGASDHA